jgi:hypothetical protein
MATATHHDSTHHADDGGTDVDVGTVVLTAVVGFALLYAIIVWLTAFYYGYEAEQQSRADAGPSAFVETLRSEQQKQLDGSVAGTIAIERAMEWVVQESARPGAQ